MKRQLLLPFLQQQSDLPTEIWYSIFTMVEGGERWSLVNAPVVCKLWATIIRRNVCEIGKHHRGSMISDALFERAPLTRRLYIWNNVERISSEGLQGLTALTSLTVATAKRGRSSLLTGLSNLTHLDCTYTYHLPVHMPKLEHLRLSENKMITGDELVNYPRLHTLDVWNCRELSPLFVGRMTGLRSLTFHIQDAMREESTHFLSHLTSLTSLELVNCNSVSEASIASLTNLTSLDLFFSDAGNRAMTYSFIERLSSLTKLVIFDRGPRERVGNNRILLPASLVTLDLHANYANEIVQFGEGISHLSNLTYLSTNDAFNLTHSLVTCLPKLVHLQSVGLSAPSSLWHSVKDRFLTLDCAPVMVISDVRKK